MKTECAHEKVWANVLLMSDPPQKQWICRLCGQFGTEFVGLSSSRDDYREVMEKFHGKNKK